MRVLIIFSYSNKLFFPILFPTVIKLSDGRNRNLNDIYVKCKFMYKHVVLTKLNIFAFNALDWQRLNLLK